jgi:GNAT superfamily N-acetyltransferase
MQTVHLTEDHVASYLQDFGARMATLGNRTPQVWATVGTSGTILGKRLAQVSPSLRSTAQELLLITYDRAADVVSFPGEATPEATIKGKRVLVIDGTVLSGGTLLRVARELNTFHPAALTSYALAVRRGAKIIPNHFGFLIGDHDRVQFPGRTLANNCLSEYGIYRKLSEEDAARDNVVTGADFMDKLSWEDRLYEIHTDPNRHVYLHELDGVVCGFLSFRLKRKTSLVDEIGVDKKFQGRGLGGHLMRWAEHYARHKNCARIALLAVDDEVAWYKDLGYEAIGARPLKLSGHEFQRMHKKLLYNLADDDTLEMGG